MSAPDETDAPPVCYRHPNRQTYVSCQRCGRPICPDCQTQAAVGVQCPECVREGRASVAAGRPPAFVRALRPAGVPVVTYVLIALCIVMYVAQWVSGGAVDDAFILNPSHIASQPWRLLTSAFLHSRGSILHILFNMYALFIFGPVLERFVGRARFLALYLIGALGGSVAMVTVWQLNAVIPGGISAATGGVVAPASSLGASGAIFALIGAVLVMRKPLGVQTFQLIIVVVLNLAIGFFAPGIAWEAHFGGFAVGAAIGAVFLVTRRSDHRTRQIAAVAGIAAALCIICIAFVTSTPMHYF
jgi:membrane associated rhomboid family serine protease